MRRTLAVIIPIIFLFGVASLAAHIWKIGTEMDQLSVPTQLNDKQLERALYFLAMNSAHPIQTEAGLLCHWPYDDTFAKPIHDNRVNENCDPVLTAKQRHELAMLTEVPNPKWLFMSTKTEKMEAGQIKKEILLVFLTLILGFGWAVLIRLSGTIFLLTSVCLAYIAGTLFGILPYMTMAFLLALFVFFLTFVSKMLWRKPQEEPRS